MTGAAGPIVTGLACRCPICGKGKLFDGYLKVAPACAACGGDLSKADPGDGPAVFVILIVGFFVAFIALYAVLNTTWPIWVHLMLWMPLAIGLSLLALRVFKSLLISLQFHFKASEHRGDR